MASLTYQTLKQRQPKRFAKRLPLGVRPVSIDWGNGSGPAAIKFSDGQVSAGSCIRCINPPCMEYSEKELELEVFKDFPADKNNNVCPTSAITWPLETDAPIIDPASCISCGVCLSRCPTRAIYLDDQGAQINDQANTHFQIQNTLNSLQIVEATAELFEKVPELGVYLTESDELLRKFREHFEEVSKNQSAQFPNHLARNLLIAAGIGAAMRRRGDTNIRMDLVLGPPGVEQGTSEVEFGAGVLDAPRNILDNVAVLVARYEVSKDNIVPIIVSLALPNQRSEYWQVIKDVRDVLDIKIASITIGALIIIIWSRALITIETGEELYIDANLPSLRIKLEKILKRGLKIKVGYSGLLESEK
jgi:NAD-dependent dihydropyrimidine dehydrogenase PreA subunit